MPPPRPHCTDKESEAQRGEAPSPQAHSPAWGCRTKAGSQASHLSAGGLFSVRVSQNPPDSPLVCRPCHTECPSSQPCAKPPIFPCPTRGALLDLLPSGKPPREQKNYSLLFSRVPLITAGAEGMRAGEARSRGGGGGGMAGCLCCLLSHSQGWPSSRGPPSHPCPESCLLADARWEGGGAQVRSRGAHSSAWSNSLATASPFSEPQSPHVTGGSH